MSYPAPENLPHDDWFMDSIPMQEWPPNSGKHNLPLPTYKDKDGNDIVNVTPPPVDIHKPEEKTMHQKMYEIATARYNPFSINAGGSENCHSDLECNTGGSEKIWRHPHDDMPTATDGGKKHWDWEETAPCEYEPPDEEPPRPEEEIYDDINDPYGGH